MNLLTREEVAQRLNISITSLSRLTKAKRLPSIQLNRRMVRYDPRVVEQFLIGCQTPSELNKLGGTHEPSPCPGPSGR